MNDLATVDAVPTEMEAELVCSILRDAGIRCMHRPTNQAAASRNGAPWGFGAREVLVNAEDLATAREVLAAQRSGD